MRSNYRRQVYGVLKECAERGCPVPTDFKMGDEIGISPSTVRDIIRLGRGLGLIESEFDTSKGRRVCIDGKWSDWSMSNAKVHRPANAKQKCMRCKTRFHASHKFHRLCKHCKERANAIEGSMAGVY
jgi:hypothetical protein